MWKNFMRNTVLALSYKWRRRLTVASIIPVQLTFGITLSLLRRIKGRTHHFWILLLTAGRETVYSSSRVWFLTFWRGRGVVTDPHWRNWTPSSENCMLTSSHIRTCNITYNCRGPRRNLSSKSFPPQCQMQNRCSWNFFFSWNIY